MDRHEGASAAATREEARPSVAFAKRKTRGREREKKEPSGWRELTGCGRGRRLVRCSTWSGGLSPWRRGGATVRRRDAAMRLRVRGRSRTVRVRVRLRERMERLVKHVRWVAFSALLKTASTH
ncbi:hypothetical protein ALC62_07966 [Cyphomyrmex costatus]|uniref:Uncharacterized protein n=1 Tax=Cyphomyrmex costatus TaxID=456900 RepID=A0A195CLJ1_9HYME|nr:hypothetical protein ALC62_07966 [Cyphomyrmex costatus]